MSGKRAREVRHLDHSTSLKIKERIGEVLDESLSEQLAQHGGEPISAVLREVADEARRWASRMEASLPEHSKGKGPHEDLLGDTPTPPKAKANGHAGKRGSNGAGHGG